MISQLGKINKYIQDYDIKSGENIIESNYLVAALYNMEYNLNINKQPLIFHKLFNVNPTTMIKTGTSIVLRR